MATKTKHSDGFGQVSRVKGVVFRYLALGASTVGILALAVLLGYVFWDAFGLWAAGLGWYGTFGLTIVLPLIAFFLYASRNPAAGAAGLELVTSVLGGLMLGIALVILLLIITGGPVWFAYFLTLVAPAVALWAYGRYNREATWTGIGILGVLIAGSIVGTVFLGPISNVGRLLGDPGVIFASVVIPGAATLWYVLSARYEYGRRFSVGAAVGLPIVAILGVPLVDQFGVVSRAVWLVLLVTIVVPVVVAVANTARDRDRWGGFLLLAIAIVGFLLGRAIVSGLGFSRPEPWLDWQFLTSIPALTNAEVAGIYPAIIGSVFLIALVALLTFALGVGAALFLEEYSPSGPVAGPITRGIRVNISNLAGVPSVVYGLLGLGIFVNLEFGFHRLGISFTYAGIGLGTVLTAAFTLSLLILPIVIISAQEAIRSVPDSMRQASYGMGATKWQTIRNVVLPRSLPGILTGTILALGRAIGETAPLLMIGVADVRFSPPDGLFSKLSALPQMIYSMAFLPGDAYQRGVTAAGVVTLLVVLLTMNSVAILLRNKFETEA